MAHNFRELPVRESCTNCTHEAMDGCKASKEYWDNRIKLGEENMVCDNWLKGEFERPYRKEPEK